MKRVKYLLSLLVAAAIAALVGISVHSRPATAGKMVINIVLEGGSGRLENGRAEIRLREKFASGTRNHEYTAHVTPRDGKAKGYLYVEEVSSSQIIVAESGRGKSDARFDYLVVAIQWSR